MKLSDIENACKGNFVWDKSPGNSKILQCNPDVEGSPNTALIVFCGLSEMYGFEAQDTYEYLGLTETEYIRLLRLYRQKMSEAQKRIKKGSWDIELNDLVQKVWVKSRLLQNYLRLKGQRSYGSISQLPNV